MVVAQDQGQKTSRTQPGERLHLKPQPLFANADAESKNACLCTLFLMIHLFGSTKLHATPTTAIVIA